MGGRLKERDIERHLVKRVKALGGEVRKVQWIGRRGAPDRLVMLPCTCSYYRPDGMLLSSPVVWVELKAPGAAPQAHQMREHQRMREKGQHVVVLDSVEGVDDLLS